MKHLLPGDVVLSDRGFNIKDSLSLYGAQLKVPAFIKERYQLPREDVEKTRHLASVRIHVERLTRQKYTMLQGPVMLPLLNEDEETGLMTFDLLFYLSESIVPKD